MDLCHTKDINNMHHLEESTGYSAYCLYISIHLHFTSMSYDFFRYSGKTNVSKNTFDKRKDRYFFHRLSRKYSLDELKEFFVSNIINSEFRWVGDLLDGDSEEVYTKWKKRTQSLSYIFQNDIDFLLDQVKEPDKLLIVKSGGYPKLLELTMQGDIQVETLCILNDIMNFLPMWNKKVTDDVIFPVWKRKVIKYTPFIEFSKTKYKLLLTEKIKEHEET